MYNPTAAATLWQAACALIEDKVSEKDFMTWILELRARTFDQETLTLTLEAPFGLFRDRVKQSFLPIIEACVSTAAQKDCQVVVEVGQTAPHTAAQRRTPTHTGATPVRGPTSAKPLLNGKTLDGFLVGESNRLAYLGAQQLAEGVPREGGNPLFLHGGVGLGKTHLLHAIAHSLRSRGRRVLLYQGEDFTRRMVEALQGGRMAAFQHEFRGADALLLDDVQFLAGKKRTQQELYHAFNLLHQAGKPIAITSDRPPDELEHLERGLQSRFGGGLLAEVGPLDRELRLRILKGKLTGAGIRLDDHVLERLAVQLQGSVREIEGLVSRLRAASSNESVPLDDDVVEMMITPYLSRRGPVDLDMVIDTVAWVHGLSRDELLSRDRSRRVAWPRHIAAYLCRKLTAASLPEIGKALGGRNHTSVLRAVRAVRDRASGDAGFAGKLTQMEKLVGTSGPRLCLVSKQQVA